MKRALLIFILIFSSIAVNAQYNKAKLVDEDNGLRGSNIKLGMALMDLPFLTPVYTNAGEWKYSKLYLNPNDTLTFRAVKFQKIYYSIKDGKLIHISLSFSREDSALVMNEFSKLYGIPSLIPVYLNKTLFGWRGNDVVLELSPSLTSINFFLEKEMMKDFYDKSFENECKAMLEQPYQTYANEVSKSESKQKHLIEKRIKSLKSSREKDVKIYKQKLNDYKESKYIKQHSNAK